MSEYVENIAILGSTGSIGCNTLEVVKNLNKNNYPVKVKYLSANSNYHLLHKQIQEHKPDCAVIFDRKGYEELAKIYSGGGCEILYGLEGLNEILKRDDYHLLVNALVGFAGLIPTIEGVSRGKKIALANKESLVVAGELIYKLIAKTGAKLLPIDSEHSAILQCIQGEEAGSVTKIILTASGGPFLNHTKELLEKVTIEEALNHPNWKMGNKITIDSATLMNKGFEIIEGKWLFDIGLDKIDVLIHPQSIIHSMVEFSDGSVKAQLGAPDMKLPIQYALTYPERIASDFPKLDLASLGKLTFFKPDFGKFECLKLAFDVINEGGSCPVVLNAANEVAVDMFLKKKIKFLDIPAIIKNALDKNKFNGNLELESIIQVDKWSRDFVRSQIA
ncbi:MAG: 1-deoxy-D-xylulose-5-phosphate reductoisomerase [Ignavibacteriae bacterium]|nr:MAG: 1-deoxy-D-xylulose-5-phosphate reductoisomerase [Ignavibacteriota bacterium]